MSLVSGSTSMISRSSAEICSNEKVKKLLRVQLKRALTPSQSKNHIRKLKSSSKTRRKRVLRPQGRSCLSSPSPPPGAWWRFLGRGRAGSVSSGGSHIWNVNHCINKSSWAGYNLQVFFLALISWRMPCPATGSPTIHLAKEFIVHMDLVCNSLNSSVSAGGSCFHCVTHN